MLLVVAATALALMMLVIVTTARRNPILQTPNHDPNLHLHYARLRPPTQPAARSGSPTKPNQHVSHILGTTFVDIVLGLLLLVVLWLLIAALIAAYRRLRLTRRRAHQGGELPEIDDAVLESITAATGRQQQLLLEGDPSDAIVACWVDLERAVAAAGVERHPSETSAELTIRVLDSFEVDRTALGTLGRLYRAARFSEHPANEQDRQQALAALVRLHSSLHVADRAGV
ncbi:DUF4129 domain-containing protein [Flexivirga caeni]|uniref:DUF4129 domain-containing protein n=1 Tax=Flexivirga caeni TaxID=2294115 RepID=A0A3M9M789_9MICO|nr:DUF4129 domain-containing protein [Flexivirga caeni]RNI21356.1 DUF4129 domain-containing protein [Flexivirga caeni]